MNLEFKKSKNEKFEIIEINNIKKEKNNFLYNKIFSNENIKKGQFIKKVFKKKYFYSKSLNQKKLHLPSANLKLDDFEKKNNLLFHINNNLILSERLKSEKFKNYFFNEGNSKKLLHFRPTSLSVIYENITY